MAASKKQKIVSRFATMVHGGLAVYLRPRLAADAKLDIGPLLEGVNRKNYGSKKKELADRITAAVKGKLAQDAGVGNLIALLDALEGEAGGAAGMGPPGGPGGQKPIEEDDELMAAPPHPQLRAEPTSKLGTMAASEEGRDEEGSDPPDVHGEGSHSQEELGTQHASEEGLDAEGGGCEELAQFLAAKGLSPEEIQEACSMMQGGTSGLGGMDEEHGHEGHHGLLVGGKEGEAEGMDEEHGHEGHHGLLVGGKEGVAEGMDEESTTSAPGIGGEKDAYSFAGSGGGGEAKDKRPAKDAKKAKDKKIPAKDRKRLAGDDPPDFPGRPKTGGTMVPMHGQDKRGTAMDAKTLNGLIQKAVDTALANERKKNTTAMDAAIRAAGEAARAEQEAIRNAEAAVRPYIGDLARPQATAAAVYKLALDSMGVDLKGVPETAYGAILKAIPAPTSASRENVRLAQDSRARNGEGRKAFLDRFPQAARIGQALSTAPSR